MNNARVERMLRELKAEPAGQFSDWIARLAASVAVKTARPAPVALALPERRAA